MKVFRCYTMVLLFIFLTINSQTSSQKSWLVAAYQMIADVIENILNTKELTQKTKIVLESYIDLLKRRGIVADKELEELCRQIWANEEYSEAIEDMVKLLYNKENITGEEGRDIIIDFEDRNNMDSKVEDHQNDIEEELKQDAKMADEKPKEEE